jgi:SAM-dependent methyltransferase
LRAHFRDTQQRTGVHLTLARNQQDLERHLELGAEDTLMRTAIESYWSSQAAVGPQLLPGMCRCCRRATTFELDLQYSDGRTPNWRERLTCRHCGMNNRMRTCVDVFDAVNSGGKAAEVYMTEQVTPTFRHVAERCQLVGSEFVDPSLPSGTLVDGIRHEDLTALSFPDASFDALLSFDVLEHIPDAHAALVEIARVLRPGGHLILTAPFDVMSPTNVRRAYLDSAGTIVHVLPPEYHGDPVQPERGILCFWSFGWETVQDLRSIGFRDAAIAMMWSAEAGYLGANLPVVVATR